MCGFERARACVPSLTFLGALQDVLTTLERCEADLNFVHISDAEKEATKLQCVCARQGALPRLCCLPV